MKTLLEVLTEEQIAKNDFYRKKIRYQIGNFLVKTDNKDIEKRYFLIRLELLIKELSKVFESLFPKYDESIRRFKLQIVTPLDKVKYEDFKIVPKRKRDTKVAKHIKLVNELLFKAEKRTYVNHFW